MNTSFNTNNTEVEDVVIGTSLIRLLKLVLSCLVLGNMIHTETVKKEQLSSITVFYSAGQSEYDSDTQILTIAF